MAAEDSSSALLEQLLAGSSGADSRTGIAALLAEHEDPRIRLLAQIWSRREAEDTQTEDIPPEPPAEPLAGARTELRLRRKIHTLLLELERLQQINDDLATALGACPLCWGEEPACPDCEGQGEPGSQRPDRALFFRLVAPALHCFKTADGPRARPITNPSASQPQNPERRLA
jgi:hypothetical protein